MSQKQSSEGVPVDSALWVTWENQRRNRSLSNRLGIPLYQLEHRGSKIARYGVLCVRTIRLLREKKPSIIFVQSPSIVLACLAILYSKFAHCAVIIDAHNAGLKPTDDRKSILDSVARVTVRNADLTIVTNSALAEYVHRIGGRASIVPDPLPDLQPISHELTRDGCFRLLFICTWASDEPYEEVIRAAGMLDAGIRISITGRYRGQIGPREDIESDRVSLTGYLPESDFVAELARSDAIIDLTTRDDCLVCGAYEAVAVERPLLTSDTVALREYFNKGTVFCTNDSRSIARGIERIRGKHAELLGQVRILKSEIEQRWAEYELSVNNEIKTLHDKYSKTN